jgi:hypothetical protein
MSSRQELQELRRNWTPPDGLERSRPREIRATAGGVALVALAAAIFAAALAAGIGLEVLAGRQREVQRRLRDEGAAVSAEVVRLWRARDDHRQPWFAYRFTTNGRVVEGASKVNLAAWRQLAVGSSVEMRYVPSAPEFNYPLGFPPRPMPAVLPYAAAAALAGLGALPLVVLRGQRRLLSEGRAARAVVTRHSKDQHGTIAHYEFATLGGTIVAGKAGPTRKPLAIGSTLCVLYDPEHPSSNAAYPLWLVTPVRGALASRPPAMRR